MNNGFDENNDPNRVLPMDDDDDDDDDDDVGLCEHGNGPGCEECKVVSEKLKQKNATRDFWQRIFNKPSKAQEPASEEPASEEPASEPASEEPASRLACPACTNSNSHARCTCGRKNYYPQHRFMPPRATKKSSGPAANSQPPCPAPAEVAPALSSAVTSGPNRVRNRDDEALRSRRKVVLEAKAKFNKTSTVPESIVKIMYERFGFQKEPFERRSGFEEETLRPTIVDADFVINGLMPSPIDYLNGGGGDPGRIFCVNWYTVGYRPRCIFCGSKETEYCGNTIEDTSQLGVVVILRIGRQLLLLRCSKVLRMQEKISS